MTFSIVARTVSPSGEPEYGVGVASKFLAVGNAVPAAVAGVGALATQADCNVAFKGLGLALLDEGADARTALDRLLADDDRPEHRQVGVVDGQGGSAVHTGERCLPWAGHRTGETAEGSFTVQGNVLAGPEVVEEMARAFTAAEGPLAHRLLLALEAGDAAGGDRRGRQSAALFVVSEGAGLAALDDVAVDLRVDDSEAPLPELRRLLDLNDFYLTVPPEEDRLPLTEELSAELEAAARAAGHSDFRSWAGERNWEMRVDPDGAWVDRRVLELVRG